MPALPTRRHVWVTGRVQGVWFRDSCARMAAQLGLAGWVRNLADGRVEVVAEGDPAAVAQLIEWCRQGPPGAEVRAVEVVEEPPEGPRGFSVR